MSLLEVPAWDVTTTSNELVGLQPSAAPLAAVMDVSPLARVAKSGKKKEEKAAVVKRRLSSSSSNDAAVSSGNDPSINVSSSVASSFSTEQRRREAKRARRVEQRRARKAARKAIKRAREVTDSDPSCVASDAETAAADVVAEAVSMAAPLHALSSSRDEIMLEKKRVKRNRRQGANNTSSSLGEDGVSPLPPSSSSCCVVSPNSPRVTPPLGQLSLVAEKTGFSNRGSGDSGKQKPSPNSIKKKKVAGGESAAANTDSAAAANPAFRIKKGKRGAAERLQGARFRMLNERLYTTTGADAFALFSAEPSLFDVYHTGFATQVSRWPVNPVDVLIAYLRARPSHLVVADFGCGEAAIAQSLPNKVHSFDLVARNKLVTACDMSRVPLSKKSVDVAVFCLSLMGTNFVDYLREAHRILRPQGLLKVAEVKSRIKQPAEFVECIESVGFEFVAQDAKNTHFVDLEFVKVARTSGRRRLTPEDTSALLQPCIYKRR